MKEKTTRKIYADNAATTKVDDSVVAAMLPFLVDDYCNISQPYSFSRAGKKAVCEARETVAECIGAKPSEIFFTSGGTESDNWALKGFLFPNYQKAGLVTSSIEHHAVLSSCTWLEKLGCEVNVACPNEMGTITPNAFCDAITDRSSLASIMYVNNEIGTIEPIDELVEIAHSKGLVFHTDAVQAVGHLPINVADSQIDLLSASAHKFNGPKGIGFLYVRTGVPISPFHNGGSQESGLRAGTENVASIVGLATALALNCSRMQKAQEHLEALKMLLLSKLDSFNIRYHVNGSPHGMPGIVSLSFENESGERLLHRLDLMGVSVSTGSACDGDKTAVSHVLRAIGMDETLAKGTVRVSLSVDNTEEEAEFIAGALAKLVSRAI